VIRETIAAMDKVAIARRADQPRAHIALEPMAKPDGHLAALPYEVRQLKKDYFDDIQDVKVTKDMLDLAQHYRGAKSASFEPEKFEDHYEAAAWSI